MPSGLVPAQKVVVSLICLFHLFALPASFPPFQYPHPVPLRWSNPSSAPAVEKGRGGRRAGGFCCRGKGGGGMLLLAGHFSDFCKYVVFLDLLSHT